mmetsp:Transcript_21445/g.83176  ORF Transcript_21445/g.83176 Transcript_21445/m.83176 type:complete len:214 (+) Transcript_21445:243-884(+)
MPSTPLWRTRIPQANATARWAAAAGVAAAELRLLRALSCASASALASSSCGCEAARRPGGLAEAAPRGPPPAFLRGSGVSAQAEKRSTRRRWSSSPTKASIPPSVTEARERTSSWASQRSSMRTSSSSRRSARSSRKTLRKTSTWKKRSTCSFWRQLPARSPPTGPGDAAGACGTVAGAAMVASEAEGGPRRATSGARGTGRAAGARVPRRRR